MVAWFIPILISFALSIIAYLIMPKPKAPQPPETQDLELPTAEAGRPIPVPFGTITIKGGNILWYGDKSLNEYEVPA